MTSILALALGAAAIAVIAVLLIRRTKQRRQPKKTVQVVLTRDEYARILIENPDPLKRRAALSAGLAPGPEIPAEIPGNTSPTLTLDKGSGLEPERSLASLSEGPGPLTRQQKRQQKKESATTNKQADQLLPSEDTEPIGLGTAIPIDKAKKRAEKRETQKLQAKAKTAARHDAGVAKKLQAKAKAAEARAERAIKKSQANAKGPAQPSKKSQRASKMSGVLSKRAAAKAQRRASDDVAAAMELLKNETQAPRADLADPFTGPELRQVPAKRQKKTRKPPKAPEVPVAIFHPSVVEGDFEVFTDTAPEKYTTPRPPSPQAPPPPSAPAPAVPATKQSGHTPIYVPENTPATLEDGDISSFVDFDRALAELLTDSPPPAPPTISRTDERFISEEEATNPDVLSPPELSPPPGRRRLKARKTTAAAITSHGIDPSELKKASHEAAALTRRQTNEAKKARYQEARAAKAQRLDEIKHSREVARRRRLALREAAKVERTARNEEKKSLRGARGDARTITTEGDDGVVVIMGEKDFRALEKERKRLQAIAVSDARKAARAAKKHKTDPTPEPSQPEVPALQEHSLAAPERIPEGSKHKGRESLRAMGSITRAERASVREGARLEKKRKVEERQRSRAISQLTQMQSGRHTPARMRAIERRARKLGLNQSSGTPRYSFDKETGEIVDTGEPLFIRDSPAPAPRYDWRGAGLPEPLPERAY